MIETHIDAATISGGYEQAGLLVYADDDNYIKFDIISDDGQTVRNRLELRSEINGAIQSAAAGRPADPEQRRRGLAAPDQDRQQLRRRVLVRRRRPGRR